jgi:hypothetical protein
MAHARMHENESMNILAPLDDEQPAVGGFNSSHACPNFGDTTVPHAYLRGTNQRRPLALRPFPAVRWVPRGLTTTARRN